MPSQIRNCLAFKCESVFTMRYFDGVVSITRNTSVYDSVRVGCLNGLKKGTVAVVFQFVVSSLDENGSITFRLSAAFADGPVCGRNLRRNMTAFTPSRSGSAILN
jgi:hypothetical protein